MNEIAMILIGCGLAFNGLSVLGALRFPDCYTRAHAIGIADTLGMLLILGGVIVSVGFNLLALKLSGLILIFFLINPTIVHAVLQAAWDSGLKPWRSK